jgi:pSer/pThr/pTyr-binding forkhead associated (FHA) protein
MPAQGAPKNRLVSIGSSPQREYSLDQPTIAIGSHPSNDVVIDDTTVSRRHATITRKPDGFELADLGSTNGTFVNGQPVRRITLTDGTRVTLGRTTLVFRRDGIY